MTKHRRPYDEHPETLSAVIALLGRVWPWFPAHEALARTHGLRWEEASTPFVAMEDARAIAHVGTLEICLVIDGEERTVGGIHAVATDPDHRKRGWFRTLMEEALDWCDDRYETLLLATDVPEIYERFGFRVVPETRWVTDRPPEFGGAPAFRTLDRSRPEDLAALHRLLAERAPVSRRLGPVRETSVFLFDTAKLELWYTPEPEMVVVARREGFTLRLLDVVAREMPSLAGITAHLDRPAERIEVYFVADGLDADLTPERWVDADGERVMTRCRSSRVPFPEENTILPFTARC